MENYRCHHSYPSTNQWHYGCNRIHTNGIDWNTNYWYLAQLTWGCQTMVKNPTLELMIIRVQMMNRAQVRLPTIVITKCLLEMQLLGGGGTKDQEFRTPRIVINPSVLLFVGALTIPQCALGWIKFDYKYFGQHYLFIFLSIYIFIYLVNFVALERAHQYQVCISFQERQECLNP